MDDSSSALLLLLLVGSMGIWDKEFWGVLGMMVLWGRPGGLDARPVAAAAAIPGGGANVSCSATLYSSASAKKPGGAAGRTCLRAESAAKKSFSSEEAVNFSNDLLQASPPTLRCCC